MLVTEKYERPNGMFVTDVWDDIREMTSGYLAGDELIRLPDGSRAHKQQSPIALLIRIILTSSLSGDVIFDPFAGTGTTLVVASQLKRYSIGVELDPLNVDMIRNRLANIRKSDMVEKFKTDYVFTDGLEHIWNGNEAKVSNNSEILELPTHLYKLDDKKADVA